MERASGYFADNFIASGPSLPEAMNKNEFLGVMRSLVNAMPDFAFNASNFQILGTKVLLTIQIQGTNTRTVSLPALGIPPLKATGTEVLLPKEPLEADTDAGRISSLRFSSTEGGGITGVLQRLGIRYPSRIER
jgi:hypothetical protein